VEATHVPLRDRGGTPEPVRLKTGAIGVVTAAVIGAGMMGLAASEYIIIGPLTSDVGPPVPLLFILGIVITIPTAISYAMMVRVKPHCGSTFEWTRATFSPRVGAFAGWSILAFYGINCWVMPAQIGLFFSALLAYFGVPASFGTFALGALFSIVLLGIVVYPGIRITGRTILVMASVEVGIMFALAATIAVVKGGSFTLHPLDPTQIVGGAHAVYLAMILMILTFIGWDVTSTVAEETGIAATRRLPVAMVLTVVVVGLIWTVATFFFENSAPTQTIVKLTASGLTPMASIADNYWGGGSLLVDITALTGSLATFIGAMTGASRVAHALGRDGYLPRAVGRLHPRYQTPWLAIHLLIGSSLAVTLVVAAMIGTFNSYVWIGSCIVFFALITYFLTNLSNLVYYHRFARHLRHTFGNVIVPVVGAAVSLAALILGFFVADWGAGFELGQSIVIFCVVLGVGGLVYAALITRRRNIALLGAADSSSTSADANV
jgi:putrescine importer